MSKRNAILIAAAALLLAALLLLPSFPARAFEAAFMVLIEKTLGRDVTTRTWDTVKKCTTA